MWQLVDPIIHQTDSLFLRSALALAHAKGIIHGDVKPGNLLLDKDGSLALADWGLAASSVAERRGSRGTGGYIAPEVREYNRVDFCSDVWSLGMICAELVSGVKPWRVFPREEHQTILEHFRCRHFTVWRKSLFDAKDRIQISRIELSTGINDRGFRELFAPLAQKDPQLCALVLQHFLNPDRAARYTAVEAKKALKRLADQVPNPLPQMVGAFIDADARGEAAQKALEALKGV